jgi:hypothetical protein
MISHQPKKSREEKREITKNTIKRGNKEGYEELVDP